MLEDYDSQLFAAYCFAERQRWTESEFLQNYISRTLEALKPWDLGKAESFESLISEVAEDRGAVLDILSKDFEYQENIFDGFLIDAGLYEVNALVESEIDSLGFNTGISWQKIADDLLMLDEQSLENLASEFITIYDYEISQWKIESIVVSCPKLVYVLAKDQDPARLEFLRKCFSNRLNKDIANGQNRFTDKMKEALEQVLGYVDEQSPVALSMQEIHDQLWDDSNTLSAFIENPQIITTAYGNRITIGNDPGYAILFDAQGNKVSDFAEEHQDVRLDLRTGREPLEMDHGNYYLIPVTYNGQKFYIREDIEAAEKVQIKYLSNIMANPIPVEDFEGNLVTIGNDNNYANLFDADGNIVGDFAGKYQDVRIDLNRDRRCIFFNDGKDVLIPVVYNGIEYYILEFKD